MKNIGLNDSSASSNLRNQAPLFTELHLLQATLIIAFIAIFQYLTPINIQNFTYTYHFHCACKTMNRFLTTAQSADLYT